MSHSISCPTYGIRHPLFIHAAGVGIDTVFGNRCFQSTKARATISKIDHKYSSPTANGVEMVAKTVKYL